MRYQAESSSFRSHKRALEVSYASSVQKQGSWAIYTLAQGCPGERAIPMHFHQGKALQQHEYVH
jgi:hypothetical protein